jgi:hypothetical protein
MGNSISASEIAKEIDREVAQIFTEVAVQCDNNVECGDTMTCQPNPELSAKQSDPVEG